MKFFEIMKEVATAFFGSEQDVQWDNDCISARPMESGSSLFESAPIPSPGEIQFDIQFGTNYSGVCSMNDPMKF